MKCLRCDKVIPVYNWKYCSIECRNKTVSKVPRGTSRRTNMVCRECGTFYLVRNSQKHRSKYCSKKCQGKNIIRNVDDLGPNFKCPILHSFDIFRSFFTIRYGIEERYFIA